MRARPISQAWTATVSGGRRALTGARSGLSSRCGRGVALGVLLGGLLSACGGGGGGAGTSFQLGGTVAGLLPGGELVLRLAGPGLTPTVVGTPSAEVQFNPGSFAAGTAYEFSIERHPAGQVCVLVRGARGPLQGDSPLRVECHESVLNDTGVADAPDGSAGRDAEAARLRKVGAGSLGWDWSRLCASGAVMAAGASCPTTDPWRCTRDNVSGLVWALTPTAPGGGAPGAQCGQAAGSWRRASVQALLSITLAGKTGTSEQAVDTAYFPETAGTVYLSSQPYLDGATGTGDGSGALWGVDLSGSGRGLTGKIAPDVASARVMWVAGNARLEEPASTGALTTAASSSAGRLLVDSRRALLWWVPATPPLATWAAAQASVAALNASLPGGYGDWRLPNRSELASLVQRSAQQPALDPAVFGGTGADSSAFRQLFWSSTAYNPGGSASPTAAWAADFAYGDLSPRDTVAASATARVIYVRNRVFNAAP